MSYDEKRGIAIGYPVDTAPRGMATGHPDRAYMNDASTPEPPKQSIFHRITETREQLQDAVSHVGAIAERLVGADTSVSKTRANPSGAVSLMGDAHVQLDAISDLIAAIHQIANRIERHMP